MHNEEFKELKQRSLFSNLRRLFSTDVIVRNVGGKKLKVIDTDSISYATDRNSLKDRFNRIRTSAYNQYSRDFTLSYQASRLELFRDYDCVGPDTVIPLPDGTYPTIAELAEKYKDKPQERFYVFSYDHETDSIKLGKAYHPRKKAGGTRKCWKVTFNDDGYIVGSAGHPLLMRNGEYKTIEEVKVGDSIMPFYQKEFYGNGYRCLYNFSKGWQTEHRIIAEQFEGKTMDKTKECVHHKDFNPSNNLPENLQMMLIEDHQKFHADIHKNILWSNENREKRLTHLLSHPNYVNRKFHHWDGERIGENNPFYGKKHSNESNDKRSKKLKEVFVNRDQTESNNPKYRSDLTIDVLKIKAVEYYKNNGALTAWGFVKEIGCDYSVLQNRLKASNLDWPSFKKQIVSTLNHKIKSIEYVGEIDVYDVTVEKYQNFATNKIFCHNTMDMDPILASAFDIYADECLTQNELGEILTVKSSNDNIKQILYNLFYDILNIEFNLWSWTRNLVKYGDFYLKLYISPEFGVYMVEPISSYNVTRVENSDMNNKNYVKFHVNLPEGGKTEELEQYQIAHFRLLSDSNFLPYGKCLAKNSYVETEYGSVPIHEIKVGDSVWALNTDSNTFELTSVLNTIESGEKDIIKISGQHNSIECSETHPILVYSNNAIQYKLANDVNINDLLVISSNKQKKTKVVLFDFNFLTESNHNGRKTDLSTLPTTPTHEFMEFLGFMFGDGWLNIAGDSVYLALGTDNTINEKYTVLLEKFSGVKSRIIYGGENSGDQCVVGSKMLAEFLTINGFRGKAITKKLPSWIYEISESLQLSFINGLVESDGSVFTDKWNVNRYSIELSNKRLVEDIKCLLGRMSIKCSNTAMRGFDGETIICGTKCNRHKSYYIYFYLDGDRKKQLEKYKFIESSDIILDPIRKIEHIDKQATYDIHVESKYHNFIANGIVVHNSIVEGARRVWKQVSLMEDAMLIHRIMRAPEKRVFKVDVGNIPPNEVDQYMERLINKTKKIPYVDETTGEYNLRFNMQNMLEDFYLPVRGNDSGTSIEPLGGMEFTGIEDIEYLRNKMMAALKIPKAFLGYDENLSGKATLASEDVRFARTIGRVQNIIVSELRKIAVVHLYSQGYKDDELVDFTLSLTNPSTIFEKEKISVWQEKTNLAKDMLENKLYSKKWIYENIFKMSEDDILLVNDQVVTDVVQSYRFKQIEEEGIDPAKAFNKIKSDDEKGGDGMQSDSPDGMDAQSPEGDKLPPDGDKLPPGGDKIPPKAAPTPSPIKEKKRDQTGRKDATRYPFGEDPLGSLENNRKPNVTTRAHPISAKYNSRPLSLEGLNVYLKTIKQTKAELLSENNSKTKSFMDEGNIIE